jgi:hypothetical protein
MNVLSYRRVVFREFLSDEEHSPWPNQRRQVVKCDSSHLIIDDVIEHINRSYEVK